MQTGNWDPSAPRGYLEDSGGISIYEVNDGTGYALVPNQRATKSHVYKREGKPGNPHNHMEVKTVNVSTNNSDGSEVTNVPVSSKFPAGLFVAMSDDKTFQYYSWAEIAGNDLVIAPNGVKQAK
jgi:myo-inositol-hexaphosphate 3-phosphohydrolase